MKSWETKSQFKRDLEKIAEKRNSKNQLAILLLIAVLGTLVYVRFHEEPKVSDVDCVMIRNERQMLNQY